MMTFSSIADRFLHSLGYEVKQCASEEEARRFAAEMPVDSKSISGVLFRPRIRQEKKGLRNFT